jgi:hypothetical protein
MMKPLITPLAAAALLLSGSAAHAAYQVDTDAFSMKYTAGSADGGIHLFTQSSGVYAITLDTLGYDMSGWSGGGTEASDATGQGASAGASTWGEYTFHVAPGYRITGLSWSGSLWGGLEVATDGNRTGSASTSLDLMWSMPVHSGSVNLGGVAVQDLNGVQYFSFGSGSATEFGTDFRIGFYGTTSAAAQGLLVDLPDGSQGGVTSMASIVLQDIQLNVHVSPVPEPGAWAMLLGGLGVLGALSRRRWGPRNN